MCARALEAVQVLLAANVSGIHVSVDQSAAGRFVCLRLALIKTESTSDWSLSRWTRSRAGTARAELFLFVASGASAGYKQKELSEREGGQNLPSG